MQKLRHLLRLLMLRIATVNGGRYKRRHHLQPFSERISARKTRLACLGVIREKRSTQILTFWIAVGENSHPPYGWKPILKGAFKYVDGVPQLIGSIVAGDFDSVRDCHGLFDKYLLVFGRAVGVQFDPTTKMCVKCY